MGKKIKKEQPLMEKRAGPGHLEAPYSSVDLGKWVPLAFLGPRGGSKDTALKW